MRALRFAIINTPALALCRLGASRNVTSEILVFKLRSCYSKVLKGSYYNDTTRVLNIYVIAMHGAETCWRTGPVAFIIFSLLTPNIILVTEEVKNTENNKKTNPFLPILCRILPSLRPGHPTANIIHSVLIIVAMRARITIDHTE